MRPFRVRKELIDKVRDLYQKEHYRKSEIAIKTGLSRPTIDKILFGLDRGGNYFMNREKDELVITLFEEHKYKCDIAKIVGIRKDKVGKILRFHKIFPDRGRHFKTLSGKDGRILYARYDYLRNQQGNKCAICGVSFDEKRDCLDHKHGSENIRGILCHRCNTGLGFIEDEVFRNAAIKYLEERQEK